MRPPGDDDRDRRIDRRVQIAVVAVIVLGLCGLALAGFGFWTDRGWAIAAGYAAAAPLMLVYPATMLTLLIANWRHGRLG
jgi:hypothetical protein